MLRDFLRSADGQSAITFMLFGIAATVLGLQYAVGTPAQMGPGFFPVMLGSLLTLVGVAVGVRGWRRAAEPIGAAIDWRAAFFVTAAVLAFSAALLTAGLLVAVPALVVVSSFAGRAPRPLPVAVTAAAMTFAAWAIFIWGLGLRIPLLGN